MGDFEALRDRTKKFAAVVVRTIDGLPRRRSTEVLGNQVLRSATAIGANYRAACRARSKAEFIAKMHTVQEEADETQYWLDLLHASGAIAEPLYQKLRSEATELTAIFCASEKTARVSLLKDHR
jgi:four helix bundle protein